MNINAIPLSLSDACCAKESLLGCGMLHFGWSYSLYQAMEWALSHSDEGFIRQSSGVYQTAFLRKRLMHSVLAYVFKTRVYARKKNFLTFIDTLVKLTVNKYSSASVQTVYLYKMESAGREVG